MANALEIRKSLEDQIIKKGANIVLFQDQIENYMFFVQQEKKMQADVRKRGMTYKATSASGKDYEKENPSVKNALLYNRQQLAILSSLGLDTDSVLGAAPPGDDGCDDL